MDATTVALFLIARAHHSGASGKSLLLRASRSARMIAFSRARYSAAAKEA